MMEEVVVCWALVFVVDFVEVIGSFESNQGQSSGCLL